MSLEEITVNKNSEFFIAICKFDIHSYVAVGVRDQKGMHHFLGAFGKVMNTIQCSTIFSTLFSESDAFIQNERIVKYKKTPASRSVRYKAYGITYEHYLQFLDYMAELSLEQKKKFNFSNDYYRLVAYQPIDNNDNTIGFKAIYLDTKDCKSKLKACPDEFHLEALGNTCRHSAIRLVETARQTADLGEGVSSTFFCELPLEAVFGNGAVEASHHFYILPLPPTSFPKLSIKKQAILAQLYERLDKMILIAQDNPNSIKKFEELKKLYQETAEKVPDSIHEVITSIKRWEGKHKHLIDTHRSWHFFSATATREMFDRLDEQFTQLKTSN